MQQKWVQSRWMKQVTMGHSHKWIKGMGGLNVSRSPPLKSLPLDEDTQLPHVGTQPPLEDTQLPLVDTQLPFEDT
jgi:hypothetical protein